MENADKAAHIDKNYVELFRGLIQARLGIFIPPDKDYLIENKLGRLIKSSNYESVSTFYQEVKNGDINSIENLIRHITTNFTFFFREKMHLKILRNDIKLKKLRKPLIWCAASSTGEEVYSIIIELLENGIENFLVVATDLNKEVLKFMKQGIYSAEKLKDVPPDIFKRYFLKGGANHPNKYKIKKELHKYFIVKKLNLVEPIQFERQFDYIFCRNVLMYFDRTTQRHVVQTLLRNLGPYGYLFIGHSESLLNMNDMLETVFSSVYNKVR